jgi:hypothetical protein
MKQSTLVTGISVLLLSGVLATGAFAQDSGTRTPQRAGAHSHALARRARAFARTLELSQAQKQQALEIARAAAPGGRGTLERIRPQLRALIATLTPGQRARIEALARRHGRTLDEARLERVLGFLLSRPGAAARIEKHLRR